MDRPKPVRGVTGGGGERAWEHEEVETHPRVPLVGV